MNEKTTVTFQMGKEELQTGVLALLQHVTITPPENQSFDEAVDYNIGLNALFNILRVLTGEK